MLLMHGTLLSLSSTTLKNSAKSQNQQSHLSLYSTFTSEVFQKDIMENRRDNNWGWGSLKLKEYWPFFVLRYCLSGFVRRSADVGVRNRIYTLNQSRVDTRPALVKNYDFDTMFT